MLVYLDNYKTACWNYDCVASMDQVGEKCYLSNVESSNS